MLTSLILGIVIAAPPMSTPVVHAKVDGEGYFRFAREGRAVYAKKSDFTVKGGKLVNEFGDVTLPAILVSDQAQGLNIDLEGNVFATSSGTKSRVGRLVLAIFTDSAALSEKDGVLISPDRPKLGNPGEEVNGVIRTDEESAPITKPEPKPETKPESKPQTQPETKPPVQPETKPETRPEAKPENKQPDPKPREAPKVGVKITVKDKVDVLNSNVTLGEIATIETEGAAGQELGRIEVAKAPAMGGTAKISRDAVLRALRSAGVKTENLLILSPDTIELSRKPTVIPAARFIEVATQAIAQTGTAVQYELDGKPLDVNIPSVKFVLLPAIANMGAPMIDVRVQIIQIMDEKGQPMQKIINSQTLKFKAKSMPVAIRSGMPVKVVMKAGTAEVELMGTARSAAKMGEPISVEVKASDQRTTHIGTVIGAGRVEVKI